MVAAQVSLLMLTFTYTFTGSQRVENRLRRGAAEMPRTIDRTMEPWMQRVRAKLKGQKVPPKRPKQRYVRTGFYQNSFAAERVKPGQWRIVNRARRNGRPYPVYVGGDNKGGGQAWMHRGRWSKNRELIDEEVPALRQALRDAVLAAFKE